MLIGIGRLIYSVALMPLQRTRRKWQDPRAIATLTPLAHRETGDLWGSPADRPDGKFVDSVGGASRFLLQICHIGGEAVFWPSSACLTVGT